MIDLDERERLARAAISECHTSGIWVIEHGDDSSVYGVHDQSVGLPAFRAEKIIETDSGIYPPRLPQANHIAANDPASVLEWVEETRRLRAEANLKCDWNWDDERNRGFLTSCSTIGYRSQDGSFCPGCGGRVVHS